MLQSEESTKGKNDIVLLVSNVYYIHCLRFDCFELIVEKVFKNEVLQSI